MPLDWEDGTVVAWNEDGTKSFELKKHHNWISSISWNRAEEKSHLFVTGSCDMVNYLQTNRTSVDYLTNGENIHYLTNVDYLSHRVSSRRLDRDVPWPAGQGAPF